MKNIINVIVSAWVILCMSACVLDNYKTPDAQFYGKVIDAVTFEPIQQDLIEGSRIDYVEQGYENPNTRQIRFQTDGSFYENNLFSGTYQVQALRGNFVPTEKEMIVINGKTEHYFLSRPYIRIKDENVKVTFDEINGTVTAQFSIEQVSENPVTTVHLIADQNPNLSYYLRSDMASQTVNSVVSSDRKFQLTLSTRDFVSGRDYYFRIAAMISKVAEAKHNYSAPVKLFIDNSKVIPDNPIPGKVFDDCESLDGWGNSVGGFLDLDTDCKEGKYSFRMTVEEPTAVLIRKAFDPPLDTEVTRENGYFAFNFFISDVSLLGDALKRMELSSSGDPDYNNFQWQLSELDLVSGWNKVELSLNRPCVNGEIDLRAVNYFRIAILGVTGPVVFKIDNLRFYSKEN